jgi:hypothetical protein
MEGAGVGTGQVQDETSITRAQVNRELGSAADAREVGGGEFANRLSCDDVHGNNSGLCAATIDACPALVQRPRRAWEART